jgi:hypothetical protein
MPHMHYSPFQFATEVQASENDVNVKKVVSTLKRKTASDKITPKLMTREEAHSIPGTPNAFISPNSVDVMRTIKSVFGS